MNIYLLENGNDIKSIYLCQYWSASGACFEVTLPSACVGAAPVVLFPCQPQALVIPRYGQGGIFGQVHSVLLQVTVPLGLCRIVSGISWALLACAQRVQILHKSELLLPGTGGEGAEWGWGALGASLGVYVGFQSLGWSAGSPQMEL